MDRVIEVVGGKVFKKSLNLLNPMGQLVVLGYASIPLKKSNPFTYWKTWKGAPKVPIMKMAKKSIGVLASHIGYQIKNEEMVTKSWRELSEFLNQHSIRPHVGRVFEFDQMPEAHQWIESRRSVGKVLVKVR